MPSFGVPSLEDEELACATRRSSCTDTHDMVCLILSSMNTAISVEEGDRLVLGTQHSALVNSPLKAPCFDLLLRSVNRDRSQCLVL